MIQLNKILKSFQKTIDQLEQLTAANNIEVSRNTEQIDQELQARLDGGATRLCRCWRVDRRDGQALGFTDHDGDIEFDGLVYRAGSGMNASAVM